MIVTDANTVVLALGDDGSEGDAARERLSGERLVAPELLDVEFVSAWRRLSTRVVSWNVATHDASAPACGSERQVQST